MKDDDLLLMQTECTMFFQENPYTFETLEGLAHRLGRKPEHLVPVLIRLESLCILEYSGSGSRKIYRYAQPMIIEGMRIQWDP